MPASWQAASRLRARIPQGAQIRLLSGAFFSYMRRLRRDLLHICRGVPVKSGSTVKNDANLVVHHTLAKDLKIRHDGLTGVGKARLVRL